VAESQARQLGRPGRHPQKPAVAPAAKQQATRYEPPSASEEALRAIKETVLAPGAPGASGGAEILQIWRSLLEAVGRASRSRRTYLLEAHPVFVCEKYIYDRI